MLHAPFTSGSGCGGSSGAAVAGGLVDRARDLASSMNLSVTIATTPRERNGNRFGDGSRRWVCAVRKWISQGARRTSASQFGHPGSFGQGFQFGSVDEFPSVGEFLGGVRHTERSPDALATSALR